MLSIHASPAAVQQTHVQRHQKSVVRCFHCTIPSTLKPLQQPLEDRHRNKDITQSNKLVRMKTSTIVLGTSTNSITYTEIALAVFYK